MPPNQYNQRNPRNSENNLYKKLTKLFSGPIVDYERQTPRKLRRRDLDIRAKWIKSAGGAPFKKSEFNPYNKLSANYFSNHNRAERYVDFDQMEYSTECATALDIYADEITTSSELRELLTIKCPNQEVKLILQNLYHNVLNIKHNAFYWARSLCKYGDLFLYLSIDEKEGIKHVFNLPSIEVERLEGEDPSNPNYIQFQWNSGGETYENWQVAHFRILGNEKYNPYGMSVLESSRRIFRQLDLLENAMMAYRIVRSPERRVFYIDVGHIEPDDIEQYVLKMQANLKKHRITDADNGRVDIRYNPLPVWEGTPIPLLNGEDIPIKEVAQRYEKGEELWVYSVQDKTKEIVPGKVVWCGKNYQAKQLVKVWLDDDTWIKTAPEHPFILRNGESKNAIDIKPGDRLMPFNLDLNNSVSIMGSQAQNYQNCKVSKVEIINEVADVYCMTVVGPNGEDDRHNFAALGVSDTGKSSSNYLKSGVFLKNSIEEDYFIPVRGKDRGTKIDTLPGGQWTGDTEDVQYLRNKLLTALKIPGEYLSSSGTEGNQSSLAQKDIRFARTILRLQQAFIEELTKIGRVHLFTLGYRGADLVKFQLSLNNPSQLAELQELESWRTKFEVAAAANEGFFSRRWIYERLFGLTKEEIRRIEIERFTDKKMDMLYDLAAEEIASEMGGNELEDLAGLEGGAGGEGGLGLPPDLEGTAGEVGAEGPEGGALLAAPGKRDVTTTPRSKGKLYTPEVTDSRKSGARNRHYSALGGTSYIGRSERSRTPGMQQLSRLGRGIARESIERDLSLFTELLDEQLKSMKDPDHIETYEEGISRLNESTYTDSSDEMLLENDVNYLNDLATLIEKSMSSARDNDEDKTQ